jgi:cysteine synthase A
MSAYGARLVLTDGALGMQGAIQKAEELKGSIDGAIIVGQFTNPSNPEAHYKTTGPEIWRDTDGKVDILVACVGTGGTLSGTGKYLKDQNPGVKVIAVEPAASPYLSEGRAGSHKIQGIGAGFLPDTLDMSVIDRVVTVADDEAYESAREVAISDGLLVGISSGAALAAARKLATDPENKEKNIVVILPDTGERYLSAGVFE